MAPGICFTVRVTLLAKVMLPAGSGVPSGKYAPCVWRDFNTTATPADACVVCRRVRLGGNGRRLSTAPVGGVHTIAFSKAKDCGPVEVRATGVAADGATTADSVRPA